MGRIKLFGVTPAWKRYSGNANANFMIKYTRKLTGDALEGDEEAELTPAKYGPGEWWLLLERNQRQRECTAHSRQRSQTQTLHQRPWVPPVGSTGPSVDLDHIASHDPHDAHLTERPRHLADPTAPTFGKFLRLLDCHRSDRHQVAFLEAMGI